MKMKFPRYQDPLIAFGAALVFALPILLKWSYIGPRDWELFITMAGVPVRTVLHYGQFPFWNPYIGGGNILFAHPEVGVLSPFFGILLLFGEIVGLKIQVLICWWLGFWGSYLMVRALGMSRVSSWMVSFTYFGSSYFALHFAAGHIPFTHFCFLPWLVFFLFKSEENRLYMIGGAAAVALIILGNGAAVPFLYTVFAVGLLVFLMSISERHFRYIKYYLFAVIFGVLIASVKFIPMYIELAKFPWEGRGDDFTVISMVPSIFFSFKQFIFKEMSPGSNWPWHEYGAYLSPLVFLFGLYALIKRFKRLWPWGVLALFFLIFGLGHFSDYSLWNMMMYLPGFASIRAPGRSFQFVVLAFAVLGGYGFDFLIKEYGERFRDYLKYLPVIPLIVITINFGVNYRTLERQDYKIPRDVVFNEDLQQEVGSVETLYDNFQRNRGSLRAPWLSAYKASRGIVTPSDSVLMEYFMAGQGFVTFKKHTPNRIEYKLQSQTGGRLVISAGYDKGWQALDGRPIYDEQGLLTVDFKAGQDSFVLNYRTPGFYSYLSISIFIAAVLLFILLSPKAGKRFKAIF